MSAAEAQMYAVQPVAYAPSMLVSTTATESAPTYAAGTTYAAGAQVAYGLSVYRSLQAANTGNTPDTSPLWWVRERPTNPHAMFDAMISTQTTAANSLVVVVEPGDFTSNMGLLNLLGDSLTVEMLVGGNMVYTHTVSLQGAEIADWWAYYFTPDEQVTQVVISDLPMYLSQQLRITVTGAGTVAIGHFVMGTRQDLGSLEYGAQSTMADFSTKTTDEFGVTTFTQRDFADEFSGQLLVQNTQLNSVKRVLRRLRATPTLYVGIEDERFREIFIAFGWVRTHRVAVPYPNESLLDFEIGALT